ncbi:MAG: DnaJ domain-containing protein [Huintestinicola sp.]
MWEILGIEPTTDIRAIKSAYARLAKKYNPEEQSEEFRRIHNAYKNAVDYAREKSADGDEQYGGHKTERLMTAEEKPYSDSYSDEYEFSFDGIDEQRDICCEDMTREEIMSAVLKEIRLTANSEDKRSDPQAWKSIVESEAFELLIMDHEFRKRAGDILFGVVFPHDAARIISEGFGYGSCTEVTASYPEILCSVSITEHILHYKPQNIVISQYKEMRKLDIKLIIFVSIAVFMAAFVFGILIAYAPD